MIPPLAVHAVGLCRGFADVWAADGFDLSIARNEIHGFLGPNGAGTSTLVRMLCTLLKPTGSRATVSGCDVVADPQAVRVRIGVALQESALNDLSTGRELLRLQGMLFGLSTDQIDRRVSDVLDLERHGERPHQGMITRVLPRLLALTAAIWHNHHSGQPQLRSLVAHDHRSLGIDHLVHRAYFVASYSASESGGCRR